MATSAYGRLPTQEGGLPGNGGNGNGKTPFSSLAGWTRVRWTVIAGVTLAILILVALFGSASREDGYSLHAAASRLGSYTGKIKQGTWFGNDDISLGPLSPDDPWIKGSGRQGLKYSTPFNPDDVTMTDDECSAFFPALYKEIDRSVQYFSKKQRYDKEYLEYACDDGIWTHARVVIYKNRVYLRSFQDSEATRTKAALSLLHLAVTGSRQKLPNVEFCIGLMDWGSRGKFGLDRAPDLEDVWLMPDYGFWSWPEHVGSYQELRERTKEVEEEVGWAGKKSKLLWRGTLSAGTADREALVGSAKGHSWSDVAPIDWNYPDMRPVAMEDYCRWKFHAFPEGNTNNGRLRYLQNCHSVLVTHEPRWVQHWSHLYNPDWKSKDQNVVFVPPPSGNAGPDKGILVHDSDGHEIGRDRTWERLPETMNRLLKNDKLARKIADNQWNFFRER